jgi:hypothetical protein
MANKSNPKEVLQATVDAYAIHGSQNKASAALGIPRPTFEARLKSAHNQGIKPSDGLVDVHSPAHLSQVISSLEAQLREAKAERLSQSMIRNKIIGLKAEVEKFEDGCAAGAWLSRKPAKYGSPGVPTLFLSDLHWGEVVNPSQINGVNEYNLEIARNRLHNAVQTAVRLLGIVSPKFDYPGIVLALGGDMISGNIHEELQATNELNTMPTVLDLYGELKTLINYLLGLFPKVFIPCVSGNHGRDTHKIWSKDRNATSFDWLLYCFLAKAFENDKRVTFYIPDGPDARYRVFNHTYLLTHGDQFRGGDGMIGALGPITRGDHKKRTRQSQIGLPYDTMIMGHWHQYIHLERLIVNGSLKGYDEYANQSNFGFEIAQQALWLTHPVHRMTYRMPVHLQSRPTAADAAWVSVGGAK